jgi:hypothetical protein
MKKHIREYTSKEVKKIIDEKEDPNKKCPHGFKGGCLLCLVAGRRGDLTGRT